MAVVSRSLTESLTYSDTATYTYTPAPATYNVSGTDTLSLSETVEVAGGARSVSSTDTLTITDSSVATGGGAVLVASDTITFTESATQTYNPVQTAADTITFSETITYTGGYGASAEDNLTIEEVLIDPLTFQVTINQLGLRDSASAAYVPGPNTYSVSASDTLTLTDSAGYQSNLVGIASDTLTISEAILATSAAPDLCEYDSTQAGPYPGVSAYTGFRLMYPSTGSPTDTVVLRNPNFGNRHRIAPNRINRTTRGGDIVIYKDDVWPTIETLLFQFSNLTKAEADSVHTFMNNHLGERIRLVDHEDRLWVGIITEPGDPVVQDRRGCSFTVSFEFQGELA